MDCSFCGKEISRGTETVYVTKRGKALYFCSGKCEKNMIVLERKPRETKWTLEYRDEKVIRTKSGAAVSAAALERKEKEAADEKAIEEMDSEKASEKKAETVEDKKGPKNDKRGKHVENKAPKKEVKAEKPAPKPKKKEK